MAGLTAPGVCPARKRRPPDLRRQPHVGIGPHRALRPDHHPRGQAPCQGRPPHPPPAPPTRGNAGGPAQFPPRNGRRSPASARRGRGPSVEGPGWTVQRAGPVEPGSGKQPPGGGHTGVAVARIRPQRGTMRLEYCCHRFAPKPWKLEQMPQRRFRQGASASRRRMFEMAKRQAHRQHSKGTHQSRARGPRAQQLNTRPKDRRASSLT